MVYENIEATGKRKDKNKYRRQTKRELHNPIQTN